MTTAVDIPTRLAEVLTATRSALDAVRGDAGASAVTAAVVGEFDAKAGKACGSPGRDAVIELEQAADSARVAAGADAGLGATGREAVEAAHLAICILKTEI